MFLLPIPKSQHHLNRYIKLISYAIENPSSEYVERHHILPKAMGGINDSNNLVKLNARQHFLAHLLLWKAYRNRSMTRAFQLLSNRFGHRINSWDYKAFKEGMKTSDETKLKLSKAFLGRGRAPFTKETKLKMSNARLGMIFSEETKAKMAESARKRKRIKHTDETKKKMSQAAKIREDEKKRNGYVVPIETRIKLSLINKGQSWSSKRRAAYEARWASV
jgi:hypothetical protein